MKTVTLGVSSLSEAGREMASAFRGEPQGAHISFASVDLLWQVLTRERWELLQSMTGQGPLATVELARRLGRNREAVQVDVDALLDAGVLEGPEDERVVFPYDAIHVDFTWTRAA